MSKDGKIFLVTVVLFFAFIVGALICNSESSLRAEDTRAQAFKLDFDFEPKGTGLDLERPGNFIYHFSAPNEDVIVYKVNDMFVVGTEDGKSFGNIISPNAQFLALSSEYILLLTEEGVISFNFPFEEGHNEIHAYDVLSDEEQGKFVFPSSYEKIE